MGSKHDRDQALDFQGFLNDLQDWELSLNNKDKKLKQHSSGKQKILRNTDNRSLTARMTANDFSTGGSRGYKSLKDYAAFDTLPGDLVNEMSMPDAASEKELGNEYFKQKKYKEAIDCYSRSIALSPTAVAYANRAMSNIKLKNFHEAEVDCTEALNLDDRYIKAYSRRATARKELGKLKESVEDAEFALRLEPDNQELKKQHADVKSLYQKEVLDKASKVISKSFRGSPTGGKPQTNGGSAAVLENPVKKNIEASFSADGREQRNVIEGTKISEHTDDSSQLSATSVGQEAIKRNKRIQKQELKTSVYDLASRAAARAMTEAAKNISPPKTAYQFEVAWRALSGDISLQARLLKITSPSSLPQIFRNALSASLLVDIVRCVATFSQEDMDLAVRYLENLTKVPRFDIIISFLSSTDKEDLQNLWNEVFSGEATPMEYVEILDSLRTLYCVAQ